MAKKLKNKKKHLNREERFCIQKMLRIGDTLTKIAVTLGRGLSTISEEVNENGGRTNYNAEKAENRAYFKQYWKKRNCNKVAMNADLSRYVEKCLGKGWSPERISDRILEENKYKYTSPKSIRKFVRKRPSLEQFLFWNRNKHKTGPKSKAIFLADIYRKSIDVRPLKALYEYGHWEGDFIVSKHNSFVLLVLVEKYSKKTLMRVLPNRNNDLVNITIRDMLKGYTVNTITFDNDIAFRKWKEMEQMIKTKIYFCNPYHSWEKGLVENTNRWIREFIKKKSDLKSYSKEYIQWIEDWLNHTPRQCLEGKTAYEILMREEFNKVVKSLEINLPRLRIWG